MKTKLFVLGLLALFAACSDDDHLSVAVTKKQLVNDIGGRYWNAVSVEKVGSNGKHYPVDIVQMYGENRSLAFYIDGDNIRVYGPDPTGYPRWCYSDTKYEFEEPTGMMTCIFNGRIDPIMQILDYDGTTMTVACNWGCLPLYVITGDNADDDNDEKSYMEFKLRVASPERQAFLESAVPIGSPY